MIKLLPLLFILGCSTTPKLIVGNCPTPKLIDETGHGFTDIDLHILKEVVELSRCDSHYTEAPCVKEFYKRGYRHYYVNCGKRDK